MRAYLLGKSACGSGRLRDRELLAGDALLSRTAPDCRRRALTSSEVSTIRRVFSTRMPTKWPVFTTRAFAREISNGSRRVETALAFVLGDLTQAVLLLRTHSQCLLGSSLDRRARQTIRAAI